MSSSSKRYLAGMEQLVSVVQRLSLARNLESVVDIVRHAARELTGADGATFVLRDGEQCHYVDEDAIGPLWKGKRFPLHSCISGWAMLNGQCAVIRDIYKDPRIPVDAYRPTFVKSLVMVPIRKNNPIGAIGNYWAREHEANAEEIKLLQALADSASVALENARITSELTNALRETRKTRDELARQLELRDEFVSIAAHELKTPLTPLGIQLQLLQRLISSNAFAGHPKEANLSRLVEVSLRQLADFTKLIENLLDVSRIRMGVLSFNFDKEVDLSATVQLVVSEYGPSSGANIELQLKPGIRGQWDQLRLVQVVRNLLSNAIRYGGNDPIHIRTDCDGTTAILVIQDHGLGIAKEDQERIFDRFERGVPLQSFGGMGLGLYITRQIVQGHGGSIHLRSKPGDGAQFTIRLPLRQSGEQARVA